MITSAAADPTDEELVARVVAGEPAWFELLVRRHNQRLYRAARSVVRDDREAEDVVQDAYVAAYLNLARFEGRARFATWLTRITVREALARSRRRREVLGERPVEGDMSDPQRTPEDEAAERQLRLVMERAIDALPEHYRTVFLLRAVQELSVAETAACLDIPEETVKTRLHRARRLLQSRLDRQIERVTPAVHGFAADRCDRLTAAVMRRVLEAR